MSSAFTWYSNYFTVNNKRGISKNAIFPKFRSKIFENYIFSEINLIFLYRASMPSTWYAKYHSTINNEEVGRKKNFFKFCLKSMKNHFLKITSFSCRRCQALSSDMQIIFIQSTIKNEHVFLLALQTDGQTDRPTFLESLRHTDYNVSRGYLNKHNRNVSKSICFHSSKLWCIKTLLSTLSCHKVLAKQ